MEMGIEGDRVGNVKVCDRCVHRVRPMLAARVPSLSLSLFVNNDLSNETNRREPTERFTKRSRYISVPGQRKVSSPYRTLLPFE